MSELLGAVSRWIAVPQNQVIAGAVALVLVVVLVWRARSKKSAGPRTPRVDPAVKRCLMAGNYEAAARLEQNRGNFESALEYFLRAQRPLRAAQMAQRLGRVRQAAELYERGNDLQRAISCYREAGMEQRAKELEAQLAKVREADDQGGGELETDDLLTPDMRAQQLEQEFAKLLAKANAGDSAAQAALSDRGREVAEALLAAGETRRAAEVCRDAGLTDQAINLFVNLLGDPGAAAPLLAERGEHQRAAELYEAAGEQQRALGAWKAWSEEAPDPLLQLHQVERLGDDAVFDLLDTIVQQRPPSAQNLDLHWRIAEAYEERENPRAAVQVLERVRAVEPQYKDLPRRLERLEGAAKRVAVERQAAAQKAAAEQAEERAAEERAAQERQAAAQKPRAAAEERAAGEQAAPSEAPAPAGGDTPRGGSGARDLDVAGMLESPMIERLVSEVATAAARQATDLARAQRSSSGLLPAIDVELVEGKDAPVKLKTMARGLEQAPLSLRLVYDSAVERARNGPSTEELRSLIGEGEPDLQNIELYYRLGLAQLAAGQWHEAQSAFRAVEQASPGYRDAQNRAAELDRWQQAITPTMMRNTSQGAELAQRYELMGELGRGGMAVVYRARDKTLGREVALKFLGEQVCEQPVMLDLFQREARAAAQLNHPNIVTIYDVGTLDGRAFISMEFVTGITVEKLIQQHQRLNVLDALRITENILSALEYSHGKHIIHRDIKPSNMMRNELGVVKLMDFGLAKSVEGQKGKTTMIAGTPSYMAPEQFTGKGIDAATDIFALGASLYEMLAGKPPFEGVQRDKPPSLVSKVNPRVPKLVVEIVQRSLEFDKARRFGAAGEMLKPIRQILGSVDSFINKRGGAAKARATGGTRLGVGDRPGARRPAPSAARAPTVSAPDRKSGAAAAIERDLGNAATIAAALGGDAAAEPPQQDVGPTGTLIHGFEKKKR